MGLFDFLKPKRTPKLPSELQNQVDIIAYASFPGGEKQIASETDELYILLKGKLSKNDTKKLLKRTKALLMIAEDKSKGRITRSIIASTNQKLNYQDAFLAYKFFTGISGDIYSGGEGTSQEDAIIINCTQTTVGVSAEYEWIEYKYGKRDTDWTLEIQYNGNSNDGKVYDTLTINLSDGTSKTIIFDITSFYGRF